MKPKYKNVTIYFPESRTAKIFEDRKTSLSGGNLKFNKGKYQISAEVLSYDVAKKLGNFLTADSKEEIAETVSEAILLDVESIEDLLKELRELAKRGRVQKNLYYEKSEEGFEVCDYSKPNSLFQKVMDESTFRVEDIAKEESGLRKHYKELSELSKFLGYKGDPIKTRPFVEGESLREAVNRALKIYRLPDRSGISSPSEAGGTSSFGKKF